MKRRYGHQWHSSLCEELAPGEMSEADVHRLWRSLDVNDTGVVSLAVMLEAFFPTEGFSFRKKASSKGGGVVAGGAIGFEGSKGCTKSQAEGGVGAGAGAGNALMDAMATSRGARRRSRRHSRRIRSSSKHRDAT